MTFSSPVFESRGVTLPGASVWALGDVLEDVLTKYGLKGEQANAEVPRPLESSEAGRRFGRRMKEPFASGAGTCKGRES